MHAALFIPNVWIAFPSVHYFLCRLTMNNLSLKKIKINWSKFRTSALLKLHCDGSAAYLIYIFNLLPASVNLAM